jgi:2-polyprenyl-6-methoxyphenol hydroxylase-like FAD-dependent oxidoreductase
MTTANTADIVIAGAGIGGLATALALHGKGIDVTVLEAAPEIHPLGVGINIQPAAIAVLTALGLGEALAASGIRTREHRYLDHTGNTLWTEPRGVDAGYDFPQYSIHRGALQMMLFNAVRDRLGANRVRTSARLRDFEEVPGGVLLETVDDATEATSEFEGTALVGADGLHSVVRSRLHPGRSPLLVTGVRMWRGLSELDEGFLDGRTMILANDENGSRLVAYPISRRHAEMGRALLNWVCLVPNPASVSTGEAGSNRPARLEDVLPYYADWDFGWLKVPDVLSRCEQVLHYPMVDREPLDGWGSGRITLLGDAAHLMYPIGANGASQAILDAAALATELAEGGDVVTALQRYEAVRRPATTEIIHANRKMDRAERDMANRPGQEKSATLADVTTTYRAAVEQR